ncbi:MAG: hypothetical protein C5B55_01825 [Blastocatellia bacterium]|nr:MAG: hypothetical protein C5B55_01825 [Blastocatellia bacterium]
MDRLLRKLAIALFLIGLSAGAFNTCVFAQETDDPVKIEMYKKFVDNRVPNPRAAYQAGKDYLAKYGKDNDQYSKYIQQWVGLFEREDRKLKLPVLIYNDKNFAEAFKVGGQILADEPEYLKAHIDLGYAGFLAATTTKNESYNTEAIAHARKAIQALESGKTVTDWAPFKGKDDTLAYLYYSIASLLKSSPDQVIDPLLKALQFDTELKKQASTYSYLAFGYESGPYRTMSTAYQTQYANKPETPESKAALEKLNVIIDHMIDAYARAVAAAGSDPKYAQAKTAWMGTLTSYYKFRHADSDAGLNDLITTVLSKPPPPKP